MKYEKIIIVIICVVLATLPFLWFKPGEVNFGGDSSRLYLYDPANYLKNVALYNIAPGETGYEVISYFYIPFTLLLLVLKTIFYTPYLLNTSYTSIEIVVAFLFMYLSVIELLKAVKKEIRIWDHLAGILVSFFYLFTPTVNHWNAALITQNQIFLNPLMFYLALRFIHTQKMLYALVALLITVLFAPNFSFASAPNFFAFYPLTLLFLLVYALWVRKISIYWKKIVLIFMLFIGLHAFHLVPQITVLINKESSEYKRVFSSEGASFKVDKGLKLSNNLMSMKQEAGISELYMVIVPLVVIMGLLLQSRQKKRDWLFIQTFFLLMMFFFAALYLDTANITPLSAKIFELLFRIPGFVMFRNYYGQFLYVFYFFYALLFAFSLSAVLTSASKNWKYGLSFLFTLLLVINGWRFLNGEMAHLIIFGSKDISVPFKMDPDFEETLNFIRKDAFDGKYMTMPLTIFGYQLLGGTSGGMYLGPSIIGYLTDKKDFTGYQGLTMFGDPFFSLVAQEDYKGVQMLLSWLNIRYLFHNEDPYIYDSFTQFPYSVGYIANQAPVLFGIKRIFPNQSSVTDFLTKLNGEPIYRKGKYSIYENKFYLPHIYVPKKNIQAQNFQGSWRFPMEAIGKDPRIVFYETTPHATDNLIRVQREGLITNPQEIPYKTISTTEGEYELYVHHKFLKEIDSGSMYIESGSNKFQVLNEATSSAWLRFENLKIEDNNPVPLLFTLKNTNSLPMKLSWNTKNLGNAFVAQSSLDGWKPQRQYVISFQYNANNPVILRLLENLNVQNEDKLSVLAEQQLTSSGWSQYQNVVTASPYATGAMIEFLGVSKEAIESSIRNVSITEIFQPEMVLRKVNTSTTIENIPKIAFIRINPTKYIIDIKDAKDPYSLVFLAAFNKKWKLFVSDYSYDPFINSVSNEYFEGDIKEGKHSNLFLYKSMFDTWGKMPIADENHFTANGYANSWFISPSDVSGKTDYILVLEMTSQRNFYAALIISGIFVGICACYIAVLLLRSYKKRK